MPNNLTNKIVYEAVIKLKGKVHIIYKTLCKLSGVKEDLYNESSVYSKAKRVIHYIKRLKNCRNSLRVHQYLNADFVFPIPKQRVSVEQHLNRDRTNESLIVKVLQHENSKLKEKLKDANVCKLKQQNKRQLITIRNLRNVIEELRHEIYNKNLKCQTEEKGTQCNTFSDIIKDLRNENDLLRLDNQEMNESDKENGEGNKIDFREKSRGKPYKSELREVYYMLRSRGIGVQHCAPIIEKVLHLVGFEAEELPGKTTATTITTELCVVARHHLLEEISNVDNITMHRDATTKLGRHYYGVQFSTTDHRTLTAGLREVKDGKATTYLESTNKILQDLSSTSSKSVETEILSKVKNFMTDRSATEGKVNKLINEAIKSNETIPSYKCAVHPLLNFEAVVEKEIPKIEKLLKCNIGESNFKESPTLNMLRSVSKLFFKDGSGDPLLTTVYLKTQGIPKIPILNLRGNRLNVLFYNARGTHYLANHLITYLITSKSTLNYMQNFILTALKNQQILCICRALGIICEIILEPYWEKAADNDTTPLEMRFTYLRLLEVLELLSTNPELFLKQHIKFFSGPQLPLKPYSENLFYDASEHDMDTGTILKIFGAALFEKGKVLFKDFLPGGIYFEPSESLIVNSKSCPPNNICVERLMATLDNKIKTGPNYTTSSKESIIMYKSNDTNNWLAKKTQEQKELIVENARKRKFECCSAEKKAKLELFNERSLIIEERIRLKNEKDKKKKEQHKTAILKDITELGFWQNETEINQEINTLKSKSQKLAALKKQINMYKEILKLGTKDKQLLLFSSKGKQRDIPQLITNLIQLIKIRIENNVTADIIKEPQSLIGKEIIHIWTDVQTAKDTKYNGKIMSFETDTFKVSYWEDDDEIDDETTYDLNKEEFIKDYVEGNLYFKAFEWIPETFKQPMREDQKSAIKTVLDDLFTEQIDTFSELMFECIVLWIDIPQNNDDMAKISLCDLLKGYLYDCPYKEKLTSDDKILTSLDQSTSDRNNPACILTEQSVEVWNYVNLLYTDKYQKRY